MKYQLASKVIGIIIVVIAVGLVVVDKFNQPMSYSASTVPVSSSSSESSANLAANSSQPSGSNSAGNSSVGATSAGNSSPSNTPSTPSKTPSGYTMAEVAAHNNSASCWSAINGNVYDLTSWIGQHPGGQQAILSICGKDGSAAFNAQHGGQRRPANELAGFKIGALTN